MRIAVNTRFLLKDKMEGFGWYTHEVCKRLVNQHPEHEFIFIFDRHFDPFFVYAPNVTPVKAGIQARHPWLFYLWFEHTIPRVLKKFKADVFFSPDGYLSLKSTIPQIAVIHDLNFEHYPQDLLKRNTRYYKKYFPLFAKKADHILTVSQFSKDDIVKQYQISGEKITVAHNGADEAFVKSSDEDIQKFRAEYGIKSPFFLSVGSIHPRKNIARLLQAFDLFKEKIQSDLLLVLVGSKYTWTDEMNNTLERMKHKDAVVFTGHLSKETLVNAYSSAHALIFPSYFEGFGIPLVEAMRCQCPVLCSNATSFPEVAEDAALYFDPFNTEDIALKMETFYKDPQLQLSLIEKGKIRVKQFNWDYTANAVWKVIENVTRA